MAKYTLRVPGVVTASTDVPTGYSHPAFVVGDPPQWNDGSDATYAELETFEHPDVSYRTPAWGDLETLPAGSWLPTTSTGVTASAFVRYQSMDLDMAPPSARVLDGGTERLSGNISGPGSSAPTWVEIPLTGDLNQFLSDFQARKVLTLEVSPPYLRVHTSRTPHTRIFEAYIVIATPSNEAPPCRIFPRDDNLGVGAGRNYPPAKSQQRSSRGVGYY